MVADYLEARDMYDLTTDTFLVRDFEVADGLIFTSRFSLHPFEFFRFFHHLLGYESQLSSLMGKYIGLIFIGLDFFIESRICSVLCFDTALYLLESVIIVSDELLDLAREDIEIENTVGKRVQKLCIMRDDEDRSLVILEKCSHMPDAIGIEIVRGLIEEEDIWVLYESTCEEKSRLLSSRKTRDDTSSEVIELYLFRRSEVHCVESFEDIPVDIVRVTARVFPEICAERDLFIFWVHDLTGDGYMLTICHEYASLIYLIFSGDEFEYGGFSSAVLSHKGDFRAFTHRKAGLIEEPFWSEVTIGDFIESDDDISFRHSINR
jgi:hypothetical protein